MDTLALNWELNQAFAVVGIANTKALGLNPDKVDYSTSAPTNAWAFNGDSLSLRFARAIWKAGDNTPKAWRDGFNALNNAAINRQSADQSDFRANEFGSETKHKIGQKIKLDHRKYTLVISGLKCPNS